MKVKYFNTYPKMETFSNHESNEFKKLLKPKKSAINKLKKKSMIVSRQKSCDYYSSKQLNCKKMNQRRRIVTMMRKAVTKRVKNQKKNKKVKKSQKFMK